MDGLADTSAAYRLRRTEVTRNILDSYHYAMKTQNLLGNTVRVVSRMLAFVNHVRGFLGNLQGLQQANEALQEQSRILTQANLQRAAFERAESIKAADEVSAIESLRRINDDVWSNWPGMSR